MSKQGYIARYFNIVRKLSQQKYCSSTAIFLSSAWFIFINPEMQPAMKMSFSKGEEMKGKRKQKGKLQL